METFYGYCHRVQGCSVRVGRVLTSTGKPHPNFHLLVLAPICRRAERFKGQVLKFTGYPHLKSGRYIMVPAAVEVVVDVETARA